MIQILTDMIKYDNDVLEYVQHCVEDIFEFLIALFFEHEHNNLYHNLFVEIIFEAILSEREEIMDLIFSQHKLLTKMLRNYNKKQASYNGHIRHICNFLRLHSECIPTSTYLYKFLQCHCTWRKFIPILIEHTKAEEKVDDVDIGSDFAEIAFSITSDQKYFKPKKRSKRKNSVKKPMDDIFEYR